MIPFLNINGNLRFNYIFQPKLQELLKLVNFTPMNLKIVFVIFSLLYCSMAFADPMVTSGSLAGILSKERSWFDVIRYDLSVEVDIDQKSIKGRNRMEYVVKYPHRIMQVDLQYPMKMDSITANGKQLKYIKKGYAYLVDIPDDQPAGSIQAVDLFFSGIPHEAENAPWDGGWVWSRDDQGNPFIATACQGLGASSWWPCKDHPSDEPDKGMTISVRIPGNSDLMAVSNGRLIRSQELENLMKEFVWEVKSPINNYGVNINIGKYTEHTEVYKGLKGNLSCTYYFLPAHKNAALRQFTQVPLMLAAFEYWMGPYPFYEDGYKLVEVPYLGMEHQSSVTYGNGFNNGYQGTDLSGTGWGMKFDFIIIHESAHEWFANNITNNDVAHMWVHESFTSYAENLFLDYYYGKEAAAEYVIGTRKNIMNDIPLVGIEGRNQRGSSIDMYYKGANVLHTLRKVIADDTLWRQVLTGLNQQFYHQTVTTTQVTEYISQQTGQQLTPFFKQYLYTIRIPCFEYQIKGRELRYKWSSVVKGFDMKIEVRVNGNSVMLSPSRKCKKYKSSDPIQTVETDRNYYIETKKR